MRFVLSAATSAPLLFLITLSSFAPAAVVVTAFEVTPDKAGFLDGAGQIKTKESGTTNEDGATTRIVGGVMADKTRYPYYAALFNGDYSSAGFFCGGSLIRPNVVITAAHCVQPKEIPVTKVAVNFTGYADQSYAHKRNVIEVVIHQAYAEPGRPSMINDIAMFFLDSPVTTEITPIQLNTEVGVPTDGQVLKAIGLGVIDGNMRPEDLMEVDLPKVNDDSCKGIWFDHYKSPLVSATMVCAGGYPEGVNKDVCSGDSGGPLVITGASPENDVLVGLTSFGPVDPCGEVGIPGVYTRISAFVDWIEGTLSCFNSTTCTSSPSDSPRPSSSPSISVNPSVAPTTAAPTVAPTPPLPRYLPGPTANMVVSLKTDGYPVSLRYRNVCNGNHTILLDFENNLEPYEKNFSVALSTGIYEFVLFDNYGNGIYGGGWSLIDARNVILYQNYEFDGVSDKSDLIIVGNKDTTECSAVLLPGPNATVYVLLYIDSYSWQTSLGYQNLCNGVETQIGYSWAQTTQYNFPVELSTGEYEFYIRDSNSAGGSGNFFGNWSVVLAGNMTLYENLRFLGKDDKSGSHLVIGSGCESTSTSKPMQSPIKEPTKKPTTAKPTQLPSISPSLRPSRSPSQNPTSSPSVNPTCNPSAPPSHDSSCENLHDINIFFGDTIGFKNCDWLSGRKADMATFCIPTHRAWFVCEETCGVCDDGCTDSSTAVFMNSQGTSNAMNCAKLSDNTREQSRLCKDGSDAWIFCPETCNSCIQPSASPSNVPTTAKPTTAPGPTLGSLPSYSPSVSKVPSMSIHPTIDATCDDLEDATFAVASLNETLKTCDWLADKNRVTYRVELCVPSNVAYHMCEETCGKCKDNCVDAELGEFPNLDVFSKMMTCSDLAKQGERQRARYCDQGKSPLAEQLCKETCNTCD